MSKCFTCGDTGKVRIREFPSVYVDCQCQKPTPTMTTQYQIIEGTELSVLQFEAVKAGMADRFGPLQNSYIYGHSWYFSGKEFMGVWR